LALPLWEKLRRKGILKRKDFTMVAVVLLSISFCAVFVIIVFGVVLLLLLLLLPFPQYYGETEGDVEYLWVRGLIDRIGMKSSVLI